MGLRDRIKRLEREAEGNMVLIPQPGVPPARFAESELKEALLTTSRRYCGENLEPHPLALAAARSQDATWRESFYADDGQVVSPVEDLSEGAS